MLDILNAGWFGLLIGTIIGIAGIWLAIIFYRRGKQVARLCYAIGDAPLIGPTPTSYGDGLEIRFEGQVVPRVTSTSYGVWNDGTITIHGRDIVEADPLRLELTGEAQILRATLEAVTRKVNGALIIGTSQKRVVLGFDYLDPGDGFRVQVVHSGSLGSIKRKGTIRGLPKGIQPRRRRRVFEWLRFGLGLIFIAIISSIVGFFGGFAVGGVVFAPWPENALWFLALAVFGYAAFEGRRWIFGRPVRTTPPRIKGIPNAITDDPTLSSWPSRNDR